jgi:hypothetical protein
VTAEWIPGWYELGPMLEVRMTADFAFWRTPSVHILGPQPLVLYNSLWHPEQALVAWGTVTAIRHADLGDIQSVNTRGLDYTITLADGRQLVVNAEEEPGRVCGWVHGESPLPHIVDWRFVVEFSALADRVPAQEGPSPGRRA